MAADWAVRLTSFGAARPQENVIMMKGISASLLFLAIGCVAEVPPTADDVDSYDESLQLCFHSVNSVSPASPDGEEIVKVLRQRVETDMHGVPFYLKVQFINEREDWAYVAATMLNPKNGKALTKKQLKNTGYEALASDASFNGVVYGLFVKSDAVPAAPTPAGQTPAAPVPAPKVWTLATAVDAGGTLEGYFVGPMDLTTDDLATIFDMPKHLTDHQCTKFNPGGKDRKAVVSAIHATLDPQMGAVKNWVTIDRIVEDQGFAFVVGNVTDKNGNPLPKTAFAGTAFEEKIKAGLFDGPFFYALVRKKGSGWVTVALDVGPTDATFDDWTKKYDAPETLFQYEEEEE